EGVFADGANGNILRKNTGHGPSNNRIPNENGYQSRYILQLDHIIILAVPYEGTEEIGILDLRVNGGFRVQDALDRRIIVGGMLHNPQDTFGSDHTHVLSDPLFFSFVNGDVIIRVGIAVLNDLCGFNPVI